MVDPDSGTAAWKREGLNHAITTVIHAAAATATRDLRNSRPGEPTRSYSGVQHNKKKAKRKQAQASRRKNRR